jgi:hypothetical protein
VQLCKADIDAIKIGHEITQNQKRDQTPHDFADDALLDVVHGVHSRFFIVGRSLEKLPKTFSVILVRPKANEISIQNKN